jgi:hypothetical protein
MFGDGDEEQVEEKPLLLGWLLAGDEEKEKVGEAVMPHDLVGEILAADLDVFRVRRTDARNRWTGLANQHDALLCRAARVKEERRATRPWPVALPERDRVSSAFTGCFYLLIL